MTSNLMKFHMRCPRSALKASDFALRAAPGQDAGQAAAAMLAAEHHMSIKKCQTPNNK
jgi:hypothetical protein